MIPGFGEVADGINALIYLGRGDYLNASLSAGAMMPFAGYAATGAKFANKAANMGAKLPVGRSGNVLEEFTKGVTRNTSTTINGTKFTGHALDQMQNRGVISPTAVLDVIKNPGRVLEGNTPDTSVFLRDNLKVITNKSGDVISVIWQ
ncbi:hypothetical protein [Moheibacter stercoris]|uniref:Uncharacterized protein n=1 Tax=Moheibacter stercoris TaxID=1628251 RepID=A0ABV2LS63_9FLAO